MGGTGASAEVSKAIKEESVEDLAARLRELDAEDAAKVRQALAPDPTPQVWVATTVSFISPFDDEDRTQRITLQTDGSYSDYKDVQKEMYGYEREETGTYTIIRRSDTESLEVVLQPKLFEDESWPGATEKTKTDISDKPARHIPLDKDAITLLVPGGSPYKAKE